MKLIYPTEYRKVVKNIKRICHTSKTINDAHKKIYDYFKELDILFLNTKFEDIIENVKRKNLSNKNIDILLLLTTTCCCPYKVYCVGIDKFIGKMRKVESVTEKGKILYELMKYLEPYLMEYNAEMILNYCIRDVGHNYSINWTSNEHEYNIGLVEIEVNK